MLLFADGFDHYATAELSQKYSAATGVTIGSGNGRNSTNGLAGADQSSVRYVQQTLTPSDATIVLGFGYKLSSLPSTTSRILKVLDSVGGIQCELVLTGTGLLSVYRGNEAALLGTSSVGAVVGGYVYIELKVGIHATLGTVEVRVNSSTVLSLTGQNTQATGVAGWATIQLGAFGDAFLGAFDIDDLYVCDGSGTTNNDFLNPIRVLTAFVTGDGAHTDFTPLSGSNFENVDETSTDGDTSYNSATISGAIDTYLMGALLASGTIFGVQTNLLVRSAGAGAEQIRPVIRISGVDYVGTTVGVSTSYTDAREVFETSPATGVAWLPGEVSEFGIELVE